MSRENQNRDYLYGMNFPRGSYALSGGQLGESLSELNGKKPTDGPPMQITDTPPGCFPDDWNVTYGASRDAYLAIVNGVFLQQSIDGMSVAGIYKDGTVNADDDNLWKMADTPDGSVQQVQYIASKTTIEDASEAVESFGEISEARGIGLRVPTIAAGYGRTIDGRPTDPSPTEDTFKRKNDEGHKLARETWKYGPIELRWDYRKSVWSAYNDLIVDHENQDLGTWVFSTNSDSEEGFPFLRGRLQDVWWIRQPYDLDGTDGTQEGVQTGEIMTHLEHRWYDDTEKAAARLSSIFIIPHEESAHEEGEDGCHFKATDTNELGDENTASAERIDIRSDVHFFKEKGIDGQIHFGRKVSELIENELLCCTNPSAKMVVGEMIFVDDPIPICNDNGEITYITDNDCKWVPAIHIDECELMGGHMVKLVTNDVNLGKRISEVCNEVSSYTTNAAGVIDSNFASLSTTIDCINDSLQAFAAANNVAHAITLDAAIGYVDGLFQQLQTDINFLVTQMNEALIACGCEGGITAPELSYGGHGASPGAAVADDCPAGTLSHVPELDCDVCYGTEILGPCTTQEKLIAGAPCGPWTPPTIDTEYGECENHSDIA